MDQCPRVLPALRGAVFARTRRPVSCARRVRRKSPCGRVRAASVLKIDGTPSYCTALRIPRRDTKVVIGQKSGGTMKRSPPHFAQPRLSGASGPPPGPIWSVRSSKVACWCLPCLLGCHVGHQRAGCGASSSLVFCPGCNDQVSQLATRYCLHNAYRLRVSNSSSAWVCLLSGLTCMGGMGCPRCDHRDGLAGAPCTAYCKQTHF